MRKNPWKCLKRCSIGFFYVDIAIGLPENSVELFEQDNLGPSA